MKRKRHGGRPRMTRRASSRAVPIKKILGAAYDQAVGRPQERSIATSSRCITAEAPSFPSLLKRQFRPSGCCVCARHVFFLPTNA
jgi:hypothetical protein